jgi:hypothetical protein
MFSPYALFTCEGGGLGLARYTDGKGWKGGEESYNVLAITSGGCTSCGIGKGSIPGECSSGVLATIAVDSGQDGVNERCVGLWRGYCAFLERSHFLDVHGAGDGKGSPQGHQEEG